MWAFKYDCFFLRVRQGKQLESQYSGEAEAGGSAIQQMKGKKRGKKGRKKMEAWSKEGSKKTVLTKVCLDLMLYVQFSQPHTQITNSYTLPKLNYK